MILTAMTSKKNIALSVIITAAGSSNRMGSKTKKEYLPLNKGTILSESAKAFLKNLNCSLLVITTPSNKEKQTLEALKADYEVEELLKNTKLCITEGGSTRQESVFKGLLAVKEQLPQTDVVLIHDGARPFVSEQIVKDVFDAAVEFGASVPGIAPVDTQKVVDANGFITQHLHRNMMCAVQTPQGFDFAKLLEAHQKAADDNQEYTDDTEIWGTYVGSVKVVKGDEKNKKITFSSDYDSNKGNAMIRVGLGYDIHQLVEGRKLILGGVEIPFEKGEKGHSDGDALLHAVTDALLGASGLGDIGSFFPPEDNKWKDANSVDLLKTVWQKITAAGWKLENLDCVIKLEQPKFLPFRENVINSIAKALDVPAEKVFVKAKTGEKMDCVGTGNAVEAWCNCLLSK